MSAPSSGRKYDAIVLDACDGTNESPCPAKAFQNVATLNMLRRALTPTGMYTIFCCVGQKVLWFVPNWDSN